MKQNKRQIVIDFETSSEEPIENGVMKYVNHPSTYIRCVSWCDVANPEVIHTLGKNFEDLYNKLQNCTKIAFNAPFDYEVYRKFINPVEDHLQWVDVRAQCMRYGYPGSLDKAASTLGIEGKLKTASWKSIDLESLIAYNKQDVKITEELYRRLPKLEPIEELYYQINWAINRTGLPVDVESARLIKNTVEAYLAELNALLPDITGGLVTKITQVQRIVKWINSQGIDIPNLQADTVQEYLERDLPENVLSVLEQRAATGLSSIGKYKRILEMNVNGRMYYNSTYYGAHTGRNTGSGFQLLNLPRAKSDDPVRDINAFADLSILEQNPVKTARALIRPMIKAGPGKQLYVADYSSIEYILLMWYCREQEAVDAFEQRLDPYKLFAGKMYHKPVDDVDKDERFLGKVGVLGCGYGMGVDRCIQYAKQYGLDINWDTAQFLVTSYREAYPRVKQAWHRLNETAIHTLHNPGKEFSVNQVPMTIMKYDQKTKTFQMILPSGRVMYYHNPTISEGQYGPQFEFMGVNPTTYQWGYKVQTPGTWVENVIQALARDILWFNLANLRDNGWTVIGHIYDEVIAEEDDGISLDQFIAAMTRRPQWCETMPLRAEGFVTKRYKKE